MDRKPTILLVDDDIDFVDLNKAVLENQGFAVVPAYSGREGLDKVRFEQPDLINPPDNGEARFGLYVRKDGKRQTLSIRKSPSSC